MFALKSYHNGGPKSQKAWATIRRFIPRQTRLFYEGCIALPGQLWYSERKILYEAIRLHKPRTVFEVGTWYGGGSTLFIAQALHDNGCGILYTVEPDPMAHEKAVKGYERELPNLLPHLKFFLGNSVDVFPKELNTFKQIDALFLDGAQDPVQTEREFSMFETHLRPGAVFIAHDWDNEKMKSIRPRIETSSEWILEELLTAPHSLGLAVYRRA
jgi:predicted O-methyltransferase YrrM